MLYNPPHRHPPSKRQQGFTLIELLMVIAVILILAGITFGISRGVQNAQARAKAKAELATISQAIEQFKSRYGDYPWILKSDPYAMKNLAYALTGRIVIRNVSGVPTAVVVTDEDEVKNNPKFLDLSKFSTSESNEVIDDIFDPWGKTYGYYYKYSDNLTSWDYYGYHLYSAGPNGDSAEVKIKAKMNQSTGVLDDDFRDVANAEGIIFAGE
jgi:prepilin-type N-terminal cleavage/methylation domain-containing protein